MSADACVKPPEQRRKIETLRQCCHADTEKKKTSWRCFTSLENSLEWYQSTTPTRGGLKVQEAEADIRSLERTEFLFQTVVSSKVRAPFTGTPHLSSHLCLVKCAHWGRCPCDRDLLVSHLGSVGGGNTAVMACACGSNVQKITVAVGENKQTWLIASL